MAKNFKEPGDKEKADAVLQVSVAANKEKYDEVRRSTGMCEALRELMKDEIEEELKKNREKAWRRVKLKLKKRWLMSFIMRKALRLNELQSW